MADDAFDFQRHFRRQAFGWRSATPRRRLQEAFREIRAAARGDPARAGEGAVRLLERIVPACERVDDSSGALGQAIDDTIARSAALIAAAPVTAGVRERWLERLWRAGRADDRGWLAGLGDRWGELCGDARTAGRWAERLRSDEARSSASACDPARVPRLSALFAAGRHDELLAETEGETFWRYACWAVAVLRARGRRAAALRRAQACRHAAYETEVDRVCEAILLESGLREEAFRRFAVRAHADASRVRWLRRLLQAYPERDPAEILGAVIAAGKVPEGQWFAAARQAGLLDEALTLARRSPAEPATLATAVKQHARADPRFAVEAGLLAVAGLLRGEACDPDKIDVDVLMSHLAQAAEGTGRGRQTEKALRVLLAGQGATVDARWRNVLTAAASRSRLFSP